MSIDFNEIKKNPVIKTVKSETKKLGFEAYIVGGYVRDKLLGILSKDIDITVTGDAVILANKVANKLKTKLSAVYKNFGTALLEYKDYKIEFASCRKESYSRKSRKPKIEIASLDYDLERRDFTINALAISISNPTEVIDLFKGIDDLKNKIIRTPLDPDKTFFDDPLRIMRAIRFATRFNFAIASETLDSIHRNIHRLKEEKVVSQERITKEFIQILKTSKPSIGLNLLFLTGVLDLLFPELSELTGVEQRNDYHHKDVFYHTLQVVDNICNATENIWLRLAALYHDIAKPATKKFIPKTGWTFHGHEEIGARMIDDIFKRLKLPLNKIDYVKKLVRLHLRPAALANQDSSDSAIRRLAAEAGEDLEDLLILCKADITSKNPEKKSKYLKNYLFIEKRIIEVQERDKLRNFQSPVRGEEIMRICNLEPSEKVGMIKKKIEEAILDGLIKNNYEESLKYLYEIKDDILNNNNNNIDKT